MILIRKTSPVRRCSSPFVTETRITIDILLNRPDIDVNALGKIRDGNTTLGIAIRQKKIKVVKKPLEKGTDRIIPSDNSLCLIRAVEKENLELVNLLPKNSADINTSIPRRSIALMVACETSKEALVKFILGRGTKLAFRFPAEVTYYKQLCTKGIRLLSSYSLPIGRR